MRFWESFTNGGGDRNGRKILFRAVEEMETASKLDSKKEYYQLMLSGARRVRREHIAEKGKGPMRGKGHTSLSPV